MDLTGRLGDMGLALLTAVSVGLAGYALLRDPGPGPSSSFVVPASPAPSTPAPAPAMLPTRPAGPVPVLLVRSPGTPGGHVLEAARRLDWVLSEARTDAPTLPQAVAGRQLVLVQAGQDDQQAVLDAVRRVRAASLAVRLVVVAPLAPLIGGQQPQELAQAVREARAQLLEPAALGWLQSDDQLFRPGGSLTPEGAADIGADLAAALQP